MLVVTTVIPNLELQIFRSLKLNTNAIMQSKLYEFKGPDKIYRLALIVSNLFTSNSQTSKKPDISKYTQLLIPLRILEI